ncbi:glycosyltransferase [Chengkuizengella sediminis]|uniref:glycosyltransferase n=1 Tax=Chengkuizengella sediminis TaxID=1885917 RepID=UPI001389B574|nr:glycosyltransferase [Chengkuizengella sediminis]NDI34879.1 glycosyltransferase family 4 protein [Chengkuizengella sediminis]
MNKTILFIAHRLDRGGAQRMLSFVADSCAGDFDKVIMLSLYHEDVEYDLDSRIEVIYLPGLNKFPTKKRNIHTKVLDTIKQVIELRKELKRIRPDLICSFGVNTIFLHVLAALGLGIKNVGSERRSPADLPIMWKTISRKVYEKCNGMVFQLEDAKNYYNPKIAHKATVIPNPYLSNKQYIPFDTNNRQKLITAGAARLEYEKGFDILIKAFYYVNKRQPEYRLIIYGAGNSKVMYGRLVDELGLNGLIEFPGLVKDIAGTVYSSSVFVLPSRFEGIPNTLLEVMGAGVPTISCDCPPGGPKFLTNRGNRGLIVPVDDHKALAESICHLIEDNNLSTKLSQSGLEVRDELRPEVISKKWTDYFKKVLIS